MTTPPPPAPVGRVVLLGASNLTRGISTVVGTALARLGGPLEFVIAMGHGRSYGVGSRVFIRSLPGIVDSNGWAALEERPPLPTWALLTDIGNDVAYGQPVATIEGWVERCLERLAAIDARIVITGLPVESLARLGPLRFRIARTLLFPGRPMQLDEVTARVGALDERVVALAERYGAARVTLPGRWYGADPIHIRSRWWLEAWNTILDPWPSGGTPGPAASGSAGRWIRLRSARPETVSFLGVSAGAPQPARRLPDGSSVSLF